MQTAHLHERILLGAPGPDLGNNRAKPHAHSHPGANNSRNAHGEWARHPDCNLLGSKIPERNDDLSDMVI